MLREDPEPITLNMEWFVVSGIDKLALGLSVVPKQFMGSG
jgi:hypothetical protein